ncbi:MAG: hypothetical protein LBG76_01400 [Treponema sp.]|jgi:hypothetical protein|nr:hypothetical protein [Treponema sp.]
MSRLRNKTGASVLPLVIALAAGVTTLEGCGKGVYIGVRESSGANDTDAGPQVHLFYDKTESMGGFTVGGDNSNYVKTLMGLWNVATDTASGGELVFYEYGDAKIQLVDPSIVQRVQQEAWRSAFYGGRDYSKGTEIQKNDEKPFQSLVEYARILMEEKRGMKQLYAAVTDLYEPAGNYRAFSDFFAHAFAHGLSGALFAIDTAFQGYIHRLDPVHPDASIWSRGESTFFVFAAGSPDLMAAFYEKLREELENRSLSSPWNSVLFVSEPGKESRLWKPDAAVVAQNEQRFNREENHFARVNLRPPRSTRELGLFEWAPVEKGYAPEPAEVEAYNLLGKTGSRYFAGIPGVIIDRDAFDYSIELYPAYTAAGGAKIKPGELSPFSSPGSSRANLFSGQVFSDGDVPEELSQSSSGRLFFSIDIAGGSLESGVWRLNYRLLPSAKVPAWVSEKNTPNRADLSGNPRGKVLNLEPMYKNIIASFNEALKDTQRGIWVDTIYLVKR